MKTDAVLVPMHAIEEAWPLAQRFLIPAILMSGGRTGEIDIYEDCVDGHSHLWLAIGEDGLCYGAAVTAFGQYPNLKVLQVQWLGAIDLESTMAVALKTWEKFAVETGCARIEFTGRRGWKKVLQPFGFVERYVFLEKDVSHGQRENAGVLADHDRNSAVVAGQVEPADGRGGGRGIQAG